MKMNRTFKWMLMTALVVGLGMNVTSCKDDDNKDENNEQIDTSDPYDKTTEAGIACFNLLSQLSVVGDSLPNDWKTHKFKAVDGRVLDESQPFVRTIAVDDMEGALQYYNDLTNGVLSSAKADTWTMDNVGTLTFTPLGQSYCYATIDVNVKQLPDLTQLRLVPIAAFPENAAFEGDPWYRLGDVIRDKEGCYWICVKPCYQPTGKDQSWWVSFNITDACMKVKTDPGLMKQNTPYNLGNKKLANGYAVQLLSVLSRTAEFEQKIGNQNFGSKGMGFAGLPADAMPSSNIPKISASWDQKDIWNKVKPKNMSVSDFKNYFRSNISMIYNSAHIEKNNPQLKIDLSLFSTSSDFYRTGQQNETAIMNMQSESFDVSTYANMGTGNASAIGGKALVMRWKDGKGLSPNADNYESQSPTKPIEGTTDIYRFNATN